MHHDDNPNKIRKVLQNEMAQLIGVIIAVYSFVAFIILPIKSIEQEINNIKNNHLHTIEMNMAEVKVLNQKNVDENSVEHRQIMEQLVKTATILDQHIKLVP
jgi:hypothetical protein